MRYFLIPNFTDFFVICDFLYFVVICDKDGLRFENSSLFCCDLRIGHDDDFILDLDFSSSCTIEADDACVCWAFNHVGLKALAIINVHDKFRQY